MEKLLSPSFKKMMNKQIDNNSWMNKLIEFYKEEMGSDSDSDNSHSDASSMSASSDSSGGGKLSSAKSSLESLADLGGSSKAKERR